MKKITAVLTALLFGVSAMSATVLAEETEELTEAAETVEETESAEMVSVVVQVPDDWASPCVWAWADDGTNAFESWPGEEMELLEEGWYYTYVPDYVQNIIISANNDTDTPVQTEGLVVEAGTAVWISVAEDASAEAFYEVQNSAEIPEYVETFIVHAYVPLSWETVNMWAWSAPDGTNAFEAWPGESMEEGEDGWFTAKAPTWVNSLIINGNEGSVQTEDITIEGQELWITVYKDLTYELAYEDPEKDVENITVYAQVPEDWESPCCWAWSAPDGTNAFTSWPGEAMTEEDGWYAIEVPGWINSVIINGNEGAVQTSDLSVDTGVDVWVIVTDAENAEVYYEEPVVE
ncbi:MAG: starch-binding protein [Lachnospiraceae bacterium]|nr:starch-binding protein [Lachnospiraceae bacterium]